MTITISSGVTSSGLDISKTDPLVVLSGGVVSSITVLSGGTATVSSGGLMVGAYVSSGGVLAGDGVLEGSTVVAGSISGLTEIYQSQSPFYYYPSDLELLSGASATSLTLDEISQLKVDSGAVATNTVLAGYDADMDVYGTASGAVLEGVYNGVTVESGGRMISAVVDIGYVQVLSGGVDSAAQVESGGALAVNSGGVATADTIANGGVATVDFGAKLVGATIENGGLLNLFSGATASGVTIEQGGLLDLASGAKVAGVTVESGGQVELSLTISSGQILSAPVAVSSAGLTLDGVKLQSGAVVDIFDATVMSGGKLVLGAGYSISSAHVDAGGQLSGGVLLGGQFYEPPIDTIAGKIIGMTLGSGTSYASAVILSGASAVSVSVIDGTLAIEKGGVATDTDQSFGYYGDLQVFGTDVSAFVGNGEETIESGGRSINATIAEYGEQDVEKGGTTQGATILSGGMLELSSGSTTEGVTVEKGGIVDIGQLVVSAGQSVAPPSSAGSSEVSFDGLTFLGAATVQIDGAVVKAGGSLKLSSGVSTFSATVSAGGVLSGPGRIYDSASIYGSIVSATFGEGGYYTYGDLEIHSGGVAESVTLDAATLVVDGGGRASATLITSGSAETVERGGVTVGAIVIGGDELVESGGVASGARVGSGGIETLQVGAVASGAILDDGGTMTAASGSLAYGVRVASGADLFLLGASASGVTVSSGGAVYFDATLSSGQTFVAGSVTTTTRLSGVTVLSGGAIDLVSATVLSGGILSLTSGVVEDGLNVSSGGTVIGTGAIGGYSNVVAGVISGISIGDATLYGDVQIVETGSAIRLTLDNGSLLIDNGGMASATVLTSGATTVYGLEIGAQVRSNAEEEVEAGGVSRDAVISKGGTGYVGYYGVASGMVVKSGGQETLYGDTVSGVVQSGGVLVDFSADRLSGTVISSGGEVEFNETLSKGQTFELEAISAPIVISGATFESGAKVGLASTEVLSGGILKLASGTVAADPYVLAGGEVVGAGAIVGSYQSDDDYVRGTISGVSIGLNEGTKANPYLGYIGIDLLSGGLAKSVTVLNGSLTVDSGAVADAVTVVSGGTEILEYGGVIAGAYVSSGGVLDLEDSAYSGVKVSSGGLVSFDAAVSAGNTIVVGRVQSTTTISGAVVLSGGIVEDNNVTVFSRGTMSVQAGYIVDNVTVASGGKLVGPGEVQGDTSVFGLMSGVLVGPSINSPYSGFYFETLWVDSGGELSAATIQEASVTVSAGGKAVGDKLVAGAGEIVLGTTSGELLSSGASEIIEFGGLATGATILSGAYMQIGSGGTATDDKVESGGVAYVYSGAVTSDLIVSAGGVANFGYTTLSSGSTLTAGQMTTSATEDGVTLLSGAMVEAGSASVLSGGSLIVSAGVLSAYLTISNGGLLVDDGAVVLQAENTLAGTLSGFGKIELAGVGARLFISGDNTRFDGKAVISRGIIELATADAIGTASVVFLEPTSGAAGLRIDAADAPAAGGTFANVMSNFSGENDYIDLASIAYVSGATATVSGSTLVLKEGGETYKFKLAGSIGDSFQVLNNGYGGTLIDPKAMAFAQTAAAFAPSDAANAAVVSGGASSSLVSVVHASSSGGAVHG